MSDQRRLVKNTILLIFIVICSVVSAIGQSKTAKPDRKFEAFLTSLDAAQLELQNGKAEAFKSVWSHADDVTLSGGFGGTVEKGWSAVSKRLDWVGQNFANGKNTIERIVTNHDNTFGYVVQLEHVTFIAPETGKPASRNYRVTMIFRREKSGWKVVHRHADSNLTKQAPQ